MWQLARILFAIFFTLIFKIKWFMVLYMSSCFWLLRVESRDFSHAEKKELLAKLSKLTKWQLFSLKVVIGCHFFGCWELTHVTFIMLTKKWTACKTEEIQKITMIFTQRRQQMTTLSENSCHFVDLLSFTSSFFQHEKSHVTQLPTAKN
jgi:hypothetical protein